MSCWFYVVMVLFIGMSLGAAVKEVLELAYFAWKESKAEHERRKSGTQGGEHG